MKKNKKKASFILCADLHIREDQPICRTDNYQAAQWKKLGFLIDMARTHECDVLCAGDIFEKAKSSKQLEIHIMSQLYLKSIGLCFFCIPGNHDLPGHNINNITSSSIGVLDASDCITVKNTILDSMQYLDNYNKKIGMIHTLIHKDDPIKADGQIISKKAIKVLKDNPDCALILSGDNHKTFVQEYQGRILVNPGSMMRMSADQIDHKPCVFLYYAEDNTVEQVFFPIEENVISRQHIDIKKEKDLNMAKFANRVNNPKKLTLNYEENMQKYFKLNKTRKPVQEAVYKIIEECVK